MLLLSENTGAGALRQFSRCAAVLGLTALLMAVGACGGGGGGSSEGGNVPPPTAPGPGVAGAPFFTYALGDRWRSVDGDATVSRRVVEADATGVLINEISVDGAFDSYRLELGNSAFSFVPLPSADALTAAIGRYDVARFPLRAGASFRAVDKSFNGSFDVDGDGRADNLQVRIDVTVVGFERVTVPAGTFDNALRLRSVITQTASLSSNGLTRVVIGTGDDWYAAGVGPVRSLLTIEADGQREVSDELLQDYRVGNLRSDTVAPTVVSRQPADGSLGANASIRLVFSEAIERSSLPVQALVLRDYAGLVVPGRSQWQDDQTLVFEPGGGGLASGSYTASLNGVPEDWVGNRLDNAGQWRFSIDATGPVLVAVEPGRDATDVAPDVVLVLRFDEALSPDSSTRAQLNLSASDGSSVPINISVQGSELRMTPVAALRNGLTYALTLSGGVVDSLGNASTETLFTSFRVTRGDPGGFDFPVAFAALAGRRVEGLRMVDINNDGRDDLLVAATDTDSSRLDTWLLLRQPDGNLASQPIALPNAACQAADLAVADLDADGLLDVLAARSFCGAFWIQQTGPGTWRDGGGFGFPADQVRAIRLVGQVRPGLIVLRSDFPSMLLLRPEGGVGTTAFQPAQVLLPNLTPFGRVLHVADLNGDGRDDLALSPGNGQVLLALQRADATFDLQPLVIENAQDIQNVQLVHDFNGDGRPDLLLQQLGAQTNLMVLLQQPDGRFPALARRYELGVGVSQVLLADVDGDGRPEVVMSINTDAGPAVDNLALFVPNLNEAGGFVLQRLLQYLAPVDLGFALLPSMPAFAVGDFSGRGTIDLLYQGQLIRARAPIVVPSASGNCINRTALPARLACLLRN